MRSTCIAALGAPWYEPHRTCSLHRDRCCVARLACVPTGEFRMRSVVCCWLQGLVVGRLLGPVAFVVTDLQDSTAMSITDPIAFKEVQQVHDNVWAPTNM
jgi:hypothetical protein